MILLFTGVERYHPKSLHPLHAHAPPPSLSTAPRTRSGYPGRAPPRGPSIATRTLAAHAPSAPFAEAAGATRVGTVDAPRRAPRCRLAHAGDAEARKTLPGTPPRLRTRSGGRVLRAEGRDLGYHEILQDFLNFGEIRQKINENSLLLPLT